MGCLPEALIMEGRQKLSGHQPRQGGFCAVRNAIMHECVLAILSDAY